MSRYAEASLSQQFDAMLCFDEARAVTPLTREHGQGDVPDTYPFGLQLLPGISRGGWLGGASAG